MNRKFKVGDYVVWTRPDGSSQSAKVILVNRIGCRITWATGPKTVGFEWLYQGEFDQLTPFGNEKFIVV